jgi:hypothetical protein
MPLTTFASVLNHGIISTAKVKMLWLRDQQLIFQHDEAKPHTGHNNTEALNTFGSTEG